MPNFLPSLVFTFSSISSSITCCRSGCFFELSSSNLVRCSMSKLVIGSPLIMQATCARTGVAHPIKTRAAPQPRIKAESRLKSVVVIVMFAGLADPGFGDAAPDIRSAGAFPVPVLLRRAIGSGKGPQTELQHKGVAKYWRRSRRSVGERRDVVGRQHEAVVDVARAHDILVDLVRYQIPSGGSRCHPVRGKFD